MMIMMMIMTKTRRHGLKPKCSVLYVTQFLYSSMMMKIMVREEEEEKWILRMHFYHDILPNVNSQIMGGGVGVVVVVVVIQGGGRSV